jgi:hypothetical protein
MRNNKSVPWRGNEAKARKDVMRMKKRERSDIRMEGGNDSICGYRTTN